MIYIIFNGICVLIKKINCVNNNNQISVIDSSDILIQNIKPYKPIIESEQLCPICLDKFYNHNDIVYTNCSHIYHKTCIKNWKIIKNICPLCNTENISIYNYN